MAVTVSTVLSILNNNSKDYSKIKIEDNKISFTDSNNAENILKFNDSGEVFYNNERIALKLKMSPIQYRTQSQII